MDSYGNMSTCFFIRVFFSTFMMINYHLSFLHPRGHYLKPTLPPIWQLTTPFPRPWNKLGGTLTVPTGKRVTLQELMPKNPSSFYPGAQGFAGRGDGVGEVCWFLQEGVKLPYLTPHISIILVHSQFLSFGRKPESSTYIFFLGSFLKKWYFVFVSFRRFGVIRFFKNKRWRRSGKHPTLPGHYRLEMLDGMGFLFRLHGMTKHGQLQAFESYAKKPWKKSKQRSCFEWGTKVVSLIITFWNTPHCFIDC